MKFLLLLSFMSLNVWAQSLELTIEGKGSIGSDRRFEALGQSTLHDAETLLRTEGGYNVIYGRFITLRGSSGDGVWQNALRFQHYLDQEYGINAPVEILAMQMGKDKIFSSNTDAELAPVYRDLGNNLSFEQKVAFGSQIGHLLLEGYDYGRMADSKAQSIVTLRDMINARKNGLPAGVCRDMTVAITQTLTQMGVKNSFSIAYQSSKSGHATVLIQDPNNASKTYTINYDDVTSNNGSVSSTHLLQDSSVPDAALAYDVYDSNGKILSTLPSGLGLILKEMTGGEVTDLDPMEQSQNSVLTAVLARKRGFDIGAGIGRTQNGDEVMALTAGYTINSQRAPGRYAVAFYSNERDSRIGRLEQKGVYLSADQRIYSRPIVIKTRGGGEIRTRIFGRFRTNVQIMSYYDDGAGNKDNYTLWRSHETYSAGTETNYVSTDGRTRAQFGAELNAGFGKSDLRDEKNFNYGPYVQDVTLKAYVGQELVSGFDGFIRATLTMRQSELGSQARTEGGFMYRWNNNEVGLVVGREGSVAGPRLAFIPGSLEKHYAEVTATFQKRFRLGAGVYCSSATSQCAVKGGGAFIMPLRFGRN